ncbi:MAG: hypothetical protein AVDCRST_MAG30-1427 [uncultured Solirubrobacteraceae bacterium]|uniref:Cardiolipin synthase N-terminal domain-containing protein n=1 Tax=uncultured Solirubrobacteraceae bacterium TaxID=1162706 RepID=A0A6J4S7P6_9ACTN|nr:MAG: hypothetical protein AVDCRST_MAG30-1427 [uncultured Solirubrobacteraceae bacterium]
MLLTFGVFGINNDGVNTAVNVLILFLVVIWAALIFWTYADARRRIDDPMLVACATAASLFPFVGSIVYAIVRPPEFLDEVYLRNLEIQAAEERLRQLEARGARGQDTRVPQLEAELERERQRRQELERAMSASRRPRRSEQPAGERPAGY